MTGTGEYGRRRRTLLEALAGQLPQRGLAGRLIGGQEPVLWVWHLRTRKQTMVLATPTAEGWLFLWSPDGQESAEEPALAADKIKTQLSRPD